MNTKVALVAAGLVAFSGFSLQGAGAWTQFRGPAGAGLAEGAKPPVAFGAQSNVLWKVPVSKGLSSPVVNEKSIFLTGHEGNRLETLCLDRKTGEVRWRQAVQAATLEKVHGANSVATPTPVCDHERVYSYFGSVGLMAYDLEGHEVWKQPLPMPKTFMNQGTATSPILVGDFVLLFEQDGDESALIAFRAADGKEAWRAKCPVYNNTWSTPMSWKEPGGQRVGLACAGRFSAFDAGTGKLVWWSDGLSRMACAVPLCVEDTLYISSAAVQGERSNMKVPPEFEEFVKQYDKDGDGKIAATEIPSDYLFTDRQASGGAGNMNLRQAMRFFAGVDTSKPLDKEAWNQMRAGLKEFINSEWNNSNLMAVRTGGKGDVSKSNRIWQESRGVPEMASAIIYGSHIYQVRSGGLVLCRDLATGKQVYEERLSAHGGYFASPVAADGRIYAASDQGVVTVIGTGDRFAELAHNDLGEPIKATPAIVDDTVFVRSEKHLWAFNERAEK